VTDHIQNTCNRSPDSILRTLPQINLLQYQIDHTLFLRIDMSVPPSGYNNSTCDKAGPKALTLADLPRFSFVM